MKRTNLSLSTSCLLAWALAVAGCASEGGIVGSGISAVKGNIVDVQLEIPEEGSAATAESALPSIAVAIEEADVATTSAADGSFELTGEFAGMVTVRFSDPSTDEVLDRLAIDVAPGALVFLRDLEIRRDLDRPLQLPPPFVFNLYGRLVAVDCAIGRIVVEDDSAQRNRFLLQLADDSELSRPDGSGVACAALTLGADVNLVEGLVRVDEGVIEIVELVLDGPRSPRPPAEVRVRRRGQVVGVDCPSGILTVRDSILDDAGVVEIDAATVFVCDGGEERCACDDVSPGDRVEVEGLRRTDDPRVLRGLRIIVAARTPGFVDEKVTGDVEAIDCAAGTLRLGTLGSVPPRRPVQREARISERTVFLCPTRDAAVCSCADIGLRDRVELAGRRPVGGPDVLELSTVTHLASPRVRFAGVVSEVACPSGTLLVATDRGSVGVQLLRSTRFEGATTGRLTCSDLSVGARITVEANVLWQPAAPSVLLADRVVLESVLVTPTPEPATEGNLLSISCTAAGGALRLLDGSGSTARVRLFRSTTIRRGAAAASCESLRPGERVRIRGRTSPRPDFDFDAASLEVMG